MVLNAMSADTADCIPDIPLVAIKGARCDG